MLTQLLFTNIHYAITVFSGLVFFATGYLHLDSWKIEKKGFTSLLRSLGFFILAAVSMIHATPFEIEFLTLTSQLAKIFGLGLILASLWKEPILAHPGKKGVATISVGLVASALIPLSFVLMLLVAFVYFIKTQEGYEKQIKPAAIAFLLLSLAEIINMFTLSPNTNIVFWSKFLSTYGPLWNIGHLFELLGIAVLGFWAWGYLRFRVHTQIFMIFITSSLIIFLVTTFSFTYLLLRNLESNALGHLKTDAQVLEYSLERLQSEALANARVVAENSAIKKAFLENDKDMLFKLTSDFMLSQNASFLTIATSSGKVIMRAEDKDMIGDNLSNDPVVNNALEGNPKTAIVTKQGVIAPEVFVRAAVPIIEHATGKTQNILGAVVTGYKADSAFVDGVKKATGLDLAVFGGDKRAATTFVAPDGKSRFIGTKEGNQKIVDSVLNKGEIYIGKAEILNQPFYVVYSPLLSLQGKIEGMLFVGKPQKELFDTAQRSIQLTLLGNAILIIASIGPAYFISRYIKENLQA